jgi:nitrile hydratase
MDDVEPETGTRNERIALRVRILEEMLAASGVITEGEVEAVLEDFLATASPLNGVRLVARAWVDPEFRTRLLADGNAAAAELGMRIAPAGQAEVLLKVVENDPRTHNILVCTLCSCYPLRLLGTPPRWYKSVEYRARVVRDPRGVLREFGLELDAETQINVWDSTSNLRYMVLPRRPDWTVGMSEEELLPLIRRDSLLGVGTVQPPDGVAAPAGGVHVGGC